MSFEGVSRVLQGRFQYFASLYFASKNFIFVYFRKVRIFNNFIEIGFKYALYQGKFSMCFKDV